MTLRHKLEFYNSPEGAQEYLEEYEKAHRKLSDRRERRVLDRFFAHMGPLRSALDLPSGWGRYLPYLLSHCERVIQSDYSGDMLALSARLQSERPVLGRVRASGAAMPFDDAAVDLVFSMRLNHHLADPADRRRHVQEVLRVARRFAVFTYFDAGSLKNRLRQLQVKRGRKRAKYTLNLNEVKGMANAAGFRLVQAPLLFVLGSGHRLVLVERAQSTQ